MQKARSENFKEGNKYFFGIDKRQCTLCQKEEDTLKYLTEECGTIPRNSILIEEIFLGKMNGKVMICQKGKKEEDNEIIWSVQAHNPLLSKQRIAE